MSDGNIEKKGVGDPVELLEKTVAIDSVNANAAGRSCPETEIIKFLSTLARDDGFQVTPLPVEGNSDELLVTFEPNPRGEWILFDSHVDTVAVDGMTIDPFGAEIRDGKLWGRGAADTKGSGAAMFTALRRYRDACRDADQGKTNVALLFSIDEESGMSGIRTFIDTHLSNLGYVFTGAVIGEPTNLRLVTATNGVQRYLLRTRGTAAHSSDPSQGRSAVSDMAALILHLERTHVPSIDAAHPLTGKAQSSINVIRGGTAVNIIPDLCEAEVDRRTVPGEDPEAVAASFTAAVAEFTATLPGSEITADVTQGTPPLAPAEDGSWQKRVGEVLDGMDLPGEGIGVKYATHAGFLSQAGIPSVVLGPGNVAQAHVKDEWIDIAELRKAAEVYLGIMLSFPS